MSAIKLILQTAGPHVVDDLGTSFIGPAGTIIDLVHEESQDVSTSVDLQTLVANGDILALDPRDPLGNTVLSQTESASVLGNHNQIHWGVVGGRFEGLDDPTVALNANEIIVVNSTGEEAVTAPLSTILGATDNVEVIEDLVGAMIAADPNLTYADNAAGNGTIVLEDNFLANDGDVLDSGTLVVAAGATIEVATGADLTIADAPINPTDAVNKEYVDMLATGNDIKDPAQAASTADLGLTFTNNGGEGDTLSPAPTAVDGVTLASGDRVLVKDQTDATQNGIYVVSGTDLVRAEDQDGSVEGEISAANSVFVIGGSMNGGTTYIVGGTGNIDVNTDPINWLQSGLTSTYSNGAGIALTGTQFSLDIETLPVSTIALDDEISFNDIDAGNTSAKSTVSDFLADLNIVTSTGVGGFAVETSENVFENRTIEVASLPEQAGLAIVDGDGIAGNPTVGLDILSVLPADATNVDDVFIAYNSTTNSNVTYSLSDILDEVVPSNSFTTWAASGNTSGSATLVASNPTDSVIVAAGPALEINLDDTTNTMTLSVTNAALVSTPTDSTDSVLVFDASASNAPVQRTIGEIIADQNLVTQVDPSVVAAFEGISVVDGDAVNGNPTIGLDIDNLTDNASDMVATDEFVAFNGTNNVSTSGQQIADGVATLLGLPELAASVINGQPIITLVDTTRANKVLSVDSNQLHWAENSLGHNDWIRMGSAVDALSGYIAPLDGTIVWATGHCENTNANEKDIHVYINGVDQGAVGTLTGGADVSYAATDINLDFNQGDTIRLRAVGSTTDVIQDTVVGLHIKWRA